MHLFRLFKILARCFVLKHKNRQSEAATTPICRSTTDSKLNKFPFERRRIASVGHIQIALFLLNMGRAAHSSELVFAFSIVFNVAIVTSSRILSDEVAFGLEASAFTER